MITVEPFDSSSPFPFEQGDMNLCVVLVADSVNGTRLVPEWHPPGTDSQPGRMIAASLPYRCAANFENVAAALAPLIHVGLRERDPSLRHELVLSTLMLAGLCEVTPTSNSLAVFEKQAIGWDVYLMGDAG